MATAEAGAVYRELEELVLRVNDHPEVRLALMARVREALASGPTTSRGDRLGLADQVERWRYQLLNHNAGHLTVDQAELTRRLDALANTLSSREPRPARSLRAMLKTEHGELARRDGRALP